MKFETIGVNYQYDAATKEEAKRSFDFSCKCCCNKGIHLDCDHCKINMAHTYVMAYFADKEARENA